MPDCQLCGKTCRTVRGLGIHDARCHTGDEWRAAGLFTTTIGATMSVIPRKIACPDCGKTCRGEGGLKNHRRACPAAPVGPVEAPTPAALNGPICPLCGKQFASARGLAVHDSCYHTADEHRAAGYPSAVLPPPAAPVASGPTGPTCRVCGNPCSVAGGQCQDCRRLDLKIQQRNSFAATEAKKAARNHRPPMGESGVILAQLRDGRDLSPERRDALRRLYLRKRAEEYGLTRP